jgi:hypothetical protein
LSPSPEQIEYAEPIALDRLAAGSAAESAVMWAESLLAEQFGDG